MPCFMCHSFSPPNKVGYITQPSDCVPLCVSNIFCLHILYFIFISKGLCFITDTNDKKWMKTKNCEIRPWTLATDWYLWEIWGAAQPFWAQSVCPAYETSGYRWGSWLTVCQWGCSFCPVSSFQFGCGVPCREIVQSWLFFLNFRW